MGKFLIKWWVIALFAIVALIFAIRYASNWKTSTGSDEKTGAIFLKLVSENGIKLEKSNWFIGVILDDLASNYSFLKYIDYLILDRFKDYKLRLIIFANPLKTPIQEFNTNKSISVEIFPILPNDVSTRRLLQGSSQRRAVCFIDSSSNIVFEANFIQENDVRLILEKHLSGKIVYDGEETPGLKKNDFFIPIRAIDVKTNDVTVIDSKLCPHLWIIFTSRCVSCALKSNLMTYSVLEDSLFRKLRVPVGLVFSPYFSMEEVEARINQLKISTDVFIAQDELRGIENPYYQNSDSENNVVCIITNPQNKVVYLGSFPLFINHLRGDYFDKNKQLYIKE